MEDFLVLKQRLEEIEKKKLHIALEEEKEYNRITKWGKQYYTTEKRMAVIDEARRSNKDETIANDLVACHEKWEKGEINHLDVMKFASLDINIMEYESSAFRNTKVEKIHSFIFGGRRDE